MSSAPYRFADISRLLRGELPWTFLVEALLRTVFLYALLLVSMRLMGKRMSASMSRNELAALVSLAAAVGPAMEAPDRGLLPAALVAAVIVGAQRLVAVGTFKSARFEKATQGDVTTLVRDGEVDIDGLRSVVLSRERVFAELRKRAIRNLGRVERMYLETNGSFTVVPRGEDAPGLSILPAWDDDFRREQKTVDGKNACASCGHVMDARPAAAPRCARCGEVDWRPAVIS